MKKISFLIFFIMAVFFPQNALIAQSENFDKAKIFAQGNTLFAQEKYEAAIQKFETLIDDGFESAELHFNLGNCFSQKKEWGKAILNYERALILDPNDEIILNNLEFANSKTVDEIEKIPEFFLAQWWSNIRNFTSSGIWAFLGILLLWAGIGGLILWLLGKFRTQRKRGFLVGMASLAVSFVFFTLSYSSFYVQNNSGSAIIMTSETPLQTLPDEISKPILQVHEGTKVKIIEKVTSWYKVRLENGEIGWITMTAVEKI